MATVRERAQKRVIKWKQQLRKGWWISEVTGLDETSISKIFRGKGFVSDDKCQKVIDAVEPKP